MPPAYQDEEKFPQPRCKRGNEPPPTRLPQNDLPLSQPSCSYILSTQQSYHSYTNSMSTMVFPGIHSDRTATPLTGRTSLQVENSQHQTSSRPQTIIVKLLTFPQLAKMVLLAILGIMWFINSLLWASNRRI